VPVERQAIMERHVAALRSGLAKTALKIGDRAPSIVLGNVKGEMVDVGVLLQKGLSSSPSIVVASARTATLNSKRPLAW